ncbi:MAG TPA: M48 family metallopeptidase [Opitutaceae bacterium]|nr:M48 family metallopeptidase [Opitutaceae bacterium]
MNSRLPALLFLPLLALSGCYTVPETGRKSLVLVSPAEEAQLGAQSFAELRSKERISNDPVHVERVRRVGGRIATAVGDDLPSARWEFAVFESPDVNAFALPGGKVGVYTGLLRLAESDDELATVIGHEIAHVTARHGAERMSEAAVLGAVGAAGTAYAGNRFGSDKAQAFAAAYGAGATLFRVLPHSRSNESEADYIGMRYAARAGYDPRAAITFWQKMARQKQQAGGGATPVFLSTHPSDTQRIADLQQQVPEVMPLYEEASRRMQRSVIGAEGEAPAIGGPPVIGRDPVIGTDPRRD